MFQNPSKENQITVLIAVLGIGRILRDDPLIINSLSCNETKFSPIKKGQKKQVLTNKIFLKKFSPIKKRPKKVLTNIYNKKKAKKVLT